MEWLRYSSHVVHLLRIIFSTKLCHTQFFLFASGAGGAQKTENIGGFRRATVAGKFRLIKYNSTINEVDRVPPDQISDLRVELTGDDQVTLTWTAVGDDGDQGSGQSNTCVQTLLLTYVSIFFVIPASVYYVAASTDSAELRLNMTSAAQCCHNNAANFLGMKLINGSLVPQISGSREILTLKVIHHSLGKIS